MCFGGSSSPPPAPSAPPPATNVPAPAGTDANQRFAQIRAGGLQGTSGTIVAGSDQNSVDDLTPTRGATVLGKTS